MFFILITMFVLEWSMSPSHPQFATADPEWCESTSFDTLAEAIAYRDELLAEGIWEVSSLPEDSL